MSRADRMKPVEDLVNNRERDAGRALAEARSRLSEQEGQLAQLQRYRDDYLAGGETGLGTTDAVRLSNRNAFLGRLSEAIQEQSGRVEAARRDAEKRAEEWRASRVESAAVERGVDRLREQERLAADRREQSEQDEMAMNRSIKPPD
jgi:flagellar FliJ protein